MQNSLISVIIPTYNRRSFLEQAIRSVLEQTQPCDELIIVDDGSTDDTQALVRDFAGRAVVPIRYLYQKNRGAAAARNLGIREAAGGFICFLDSDDHFAPHKLAVQKHILEESDCLISHTGEQWRRRGKHLNQKHRHQPPDGYIFEQCLQMCVVGMSTVLVRRELFDRYGLFDESFPCCEDYDLWLRISSREQFRLVPQPLTIKNGGRGDQLSVIHRQGMDKFRIRALINLLDQGSLTSTQYSLAAGELRIKCEIYGNGCIKHGRPDEGRGYLAIPDRYSKS